MPKFSSEYTTRIFRHQVECNHRTIFVVVGEGSKHQIPVLHGRLCAASELNSIIWCYKNVETVLDRESKKMKPSEGDSEFEKWLKTSNVEHISYKEGGRLLGRTCDMLVLQDFESLTCNTMACALETVRGGGAIVFLFDTEKTIQEIISSRSELVAEKIGSTSVPRFNRRLFKFLIQFPFAVFLDSKLKVMSITTENPIAKDPAPSATGGSPAVASIPSDSTADARLYAICKTKDQLEVLKSLMAHLDTNEPSLSSVVAERGRGKSAAMGLAIVGAIERRFPLVLISSLFLDNVQSIFDFVVAGLDALEYKKAKDYRVNYVFHGKKRVIGSIEIIREFRRTVEFIQSFEELKVYPSLLVVDEAAAIPLPNLKRLLDARLVFIASTSSGYEGTGRVFRTKLADYIKERPVRSASYEMKEPIRYAAGDEVESWLSKTLLLEPKVKPLQQSPFPDECTMYYVNKDALFSGNPKTEGFLNEIFSVFVASHYRNSPNDIQILSDSPSHEIFVLMTPGSPHRVLCAIQVSFEGKCKKSAFSKEGSLIPWVIYDNFLDESFLDTLGVRIVRIAVHQNILSMGYGTAAVAALTRLFTTRDSPGVTPAAGPEGSMSSYVSSADPTVLFHSIDQITVPSISWMGASFGVSERLLNFWKRSGFSPVCIKQIPSKTTGDFSAVVMKSICAGPVLGEMSVQFLQRFVTLLSYSFRDLPPTLGLSLIYSSDVSVRDKQISLSADEINRLRLFSKRMIDIFGVMDILPDVARLYFYQNDINAVSVVSQTALLMIGCQHRRVNCVAEYLGVDYCKVSDLIAAAVDAVLDK